MKTAKAGSNFSFLFTCLGVLTLVGCAAAPVKTLQEIPFESEAIRIRLKADSMLNLYDDEPHTLVLCAYQLSSAEVFREMAKSKSGVVRLLACSSYADSVVTFQRIILHPGEVRTVTMDREKAARSLGLVAGYFESTPDKMTRLYHVPVQTVDKGIWFWRERFEKPKKLSIELILDPGGIRKVDQLPVTRRTRKSRQKSRSAAAPSRSPSLPQLKLPPVPELTVQPREEREEAQKPEKKEIEEKQEEQEGEEEEEKQEDRAFAPSSEQERPLWRTWWPYAIGSGTLLTAAVVAHVASSSYDSGSGAGNMRTASATWRGVAIGFYVLSGVCAATSAILHLTWKAPDEASQQAFAPAVGPDFVGLTWSVAF